MAETTQERPYALLRAWMDSTPGKRGLARLHALGIEWGNRNRPDRIVEELGKADFAPALPPLNTARDEVAFLAGACWTLAWIANRSRSQP